MRRFSWWIDQQLSAIQPQAHEEQWSVGCPEQLPNLMHCIRFRLQKSRGVKGQGWA